MKKNVFLVAFGAILIGIGYSLYLYNKPHRAVSEENSSYVGLATNLFDKCIEDSVYYIQNIKNKAVTVTGKVSSKEQNSFSLNSGFICYLDSSQSIDNITVDKPITIKGRVAGIEKDDFLGYTYITIDYASIIDDK